MSILSRTVFYDNTDGIARFWDWARVTTTLGTMIEPFIPGQRHAINEDFEAFIPDDEINRIDNLRAKPIDFEKVLLSGGDDQHFMGGAQLPRDGR